MLRVIGIIIAVCAVCWIYFFSPEFNLINNLIIILCGIISGIFIFTKKDG